MAAIAGIIAALAAILALAAFTYREYTRRLRARLRVISGCGHLLIGERPDACEHAIEDFLGNGRFEGHHLSS